MIQFVEQGTQFNLDYGAVDMESLKPLFSMYSRAVEAVIRLPVSEQGPFRKRLLERTQSSEGIGWGYPEALLEQYDDAFPGND
jgi:hypothetical protein